MQMQRAEMATVGGAWTEGPALGTQIKDRYFVGKGIYSVPTLEVL
jgi:hypothetical protein